MCFEKSVLQPTRFLKSLTYVLVFLLLISFVLLSNYNEASFSRSDSAISTLHVVNHTFPSIGGRASECLEMNELLRVFMYDLPEEFHFGLLGWRGGDGNVWPDVQNQEEVPKYPGGLNLQHSVEYWLTLDLLWSNRPGPPRPCTAIRVANSSQADVIFVPFFSSLSYNRYSKGRGGENKVLQEKLVRFLKGREEWRRRGGRDHIIVAHHPNSLLDVRRSLASAMFVVADFGRYSTEVANVGKDIVAPYHHLVNSVNESSSPGFEDRHVLAFFQGALYRKDKGMIRQELYRLLKGEEDVEFRYGSVKERGGIRGAGRGMASSKFCLVIAGDTPSSNRLFDAVVSHCVPVIISDDIELPFEDLLDYSSFCLFVPSARSLSPAFLTTLRRLPPLSWARMWRNLKLVSPHFEYHFPSRPLDALDMFWRSVRLRLSPHSPRPSNRDRRLRLLKKRMKKPCSG